MKQEKHAKEWKYIPKNLQVQEINRIFAAGILKAIENLHNQIVEKADSPFEIEVVSYLVKKGYHVTQQWPVGAYRLDMVVQYKNNKVAIECDGEKYHGADMIASFNDNGNICSGRSRR